MTILTSEVAEALASVGFDLLLSQLAQLDAVCTVDLLANAADLVDNGEVEVVQILESRLSLACRDDCLSKGTSTGTTLSPVVANDSSIGTAGQRLLPDELKLSRRVRPM